MGIFLNPLSLNFKTQKKSGYVDKSGLISLLNARIDTEDRYVCVSRPRRFGKTMAATMIAAYYMTGLDSDSVFSDLVISKDPSYKIHMNKYNVIFLNIQDFWAPTKDAGKMSAMVESALADDFKEAFKSLSMRDKPLFMQLHQIHNSFGKQFIFVIDEWDCVIRSGIDNVQKRAYLEFLDNMLKGKPYVALAYITGILPAYGHDSTLNMFDKYSMIDPQEFAEFAGFTESEARSLCDAAFMDFNEIKNWYEGYKLGDTHIYSPMSVSSAAKKRMIKNYWTETEAFESLKEYICMDYAGLKETIVYLLDDRKNTAPINPKAFPSDIHKMSSADDVLTLLIHLGYLGFDASANEVFIPNMEVAENFAGSIKEPIWAGLIEIIEFSKQVLENTLAMNADKVAKAIEKVHMKIVDIKKYNSEEALSYVISWSYMYAGKYYNKFNELASGKGFVDVVFVPKHGCKNKPSLLIELKWNKSAIGALKQIENNEYTDKILEMAGDNILLIGINYSARTKRHTCVIKRFNGQQPK
jgi:hypothetical protein